MTKPRRSPPLVAVIYPILTLGVSFAVVAFLKAALPTSLFEMIRDWLELGVLLSSGLSYVVGLVQIRKQEASRDDPSKPIPRPTSLLWRWAQRAVTLGVLIALIGELIRDFSGLAIPLWVPFIHSVTFIVVMTQGTALWLSQWQGDQKESAWQAVSHTIQQFRTTLPWNRAGDNAAMAREARKLLEDVLAVLDSNIDCAIPPLFARWERNKVQVPRFVFVLVPDIDAGVLRVVCAANSGQRPQYQELMKYTPRLHDEARFASFRTKWENKVPDGEAGWKEYYADSAEATSLCGAVWARKTQPGHVEIADIEARRRENPRDFLEFNHEKHLAGVRLRTVYIRPLEVAGEYCGLLVIVDPVKDALRQRDQDLRDAVVHMAEPALYRLKAFAEKASLKPWRLDG